MVRRIPYCKDRKDPRLRLIGVYEIDLLEISQVFVIRSTSRPGHLQSSQRREVVRR